MPESSNHLRYHFAGFTLDTARSVLFQGEKELRLRPQSFDVLQFLLEKHGELVTRDELHAAIWANRAVTDDSLAQCVVEIRRVLSDSAKVLVKTVPRRGYLVDGDVAIELVDSSPSVEQGQKPVLRMAAVLVLVAICTYFVWSHWLDAPAPNSIAVLPFIDMSREQDLRHVGDSLAEDILNTLAHRSDLSVIARTSSFAYSTEARDIESIGKALNVAYVLEGSVRHDGGNYRVVAQLIDTDDSTHVWSEAFTTPAADLPQVHEQISRLVWRELRPDALRDTDVDVYAGISASEQMMLARQYEIRVREQPEVDQQALQRAINLYRDASIANPNSAIAFAGLARVLLFGGELDDARAAVDAALRINPDLSEVQEVLARLRWVTAEAGAGEAWRRATELNPGSADAAGAYGYWLWMQGYMDIASRELYRAKETDPGSLSRYADLGNFLANEARIEEVDELIDEILGRFDTPESYRVVARMLDLVGRVDESIGWLLRARGRQPGDPTFNWAIAELLVDIGAYDAALELEPEPPLGVLLKMGSPDEFIDKAELAVIDDPADITLQYLLAFAYDANGDFEQAVRLLDRARVLDMMRPVTRNIWDFEALHTWIHANVQIGNDDITTGAVDMLRNYQYTKSSNWWVSYYDACREASVGNDDIALDSLEKAYLSPRLPLLYLYRDAGCMHSLRTRPRYTAVLEQIRARQLALRERLPATLQEFGVSLR